MPEGRGRLVGALVVRDADEIFAITSTGVVIRMSVQPLRYLSRPTGGVKLVSLDAGATVVAVAHNGEAAAEAEAVALVGSAPADLPGGDEEVPDVADTEPAGSPVMLEGDAPASGEGVPPEPSRGAGGPDAPPDDEESPA